MNTRRDPKDQQYVPAPDLFYTGLVDPSVHQFGGGEDPEAWWPTKEQRHQPDSLDANQLSFAPQLKDDSSRSTFIDPSIATSIASGYPQPRATHFSDTDDYCQDWVIPHQPHQPISNRSLAFTVDMAETHQKGYVGVYRSPDGLHFRTSQPPAVSPGLIENEYTAGSAPTQPLPEPESIGMARISDGPHHRASCIQTAPQRIEDAAFRPPSHKTKQRVPHVCHLTPCKHPKPFARKADLKRHQKTHHPLSNAELFSCPFPGCNSTGFPRRDKMLLHQDKVHGGRMGAELEVSYTPNAM